MLGVRRLAVMPGAVLVAVALAACGGSSHPGIADHTVPSAAQTKAQIKSAYEKFFSSNTSIPDRVALLQNGPRFKGVVTSFANNPLASNTSATVSSVTLQGANRARVVYTVKVAGAGLPKQTGAAVRENGTWKVGDASLCKLIALGGTTPSVCKS